MVPSCRRQTAPCPPSGERQRRHSAASIPAGPSSSGISSPSISNRLRPATPCRSPYSPAVDSTTPRICSSRFTHNRHRLALAVEVGLHVAEPFDDGLDPVPEPGAGQVLVNQFHLGLLAFASQPGCHRASRSHGPVLAAPAVGDGVRALRRARYLARPVNGTRGADALSVG